jgi:hypothetical protein
MPGTTTVIETTEAGNMTLHCHAPSKYLRFAFIARDDQTPTADGAYYGQFSNITVYDEQVQSTPWKLDTILIGACSELSTT